MKSVDFGLMFYVLLIGLMVVLMVNAEAQVMSKDASLISTPGERYI
jgi:hypothetical protein